MSKFITAILILAAGFIFSVNASGTTGFNFLTLGIGSRAQGMGNAYTALSHDVNGLYYNPAGPAFSVLPSVMFYHAAWVEDISIENISMVYPYQKFTLTGGISYLHLPGISGYDIDPLTEEPIDLGQFNVSDFMAQFGFGYMVSPNFSVGIQTKLVQERIENVVASGMLFDFGALYRTSIKYLSVGVAVQNLGSAVKYETQSEKLPLTYRLGFAYRLPLHTVTFAMDAVKRADEGWRAYSGVEVELLNSLFLRGGYEFQRALDSGYDFGLGAKIMDKYRFDYVFSPYGILGNTHRVEFVLNFGNIFNTQHASQIKSKKEAISEINGRQLPSSVGNSNAKNLPVPNGLHAEKRGKQIVFTWQPVPLKDAEYNIYVKIPGKSHLTKITKTPVKENQFIFTPRTNKLTVAFILTACRNDRESELSKPYYFNFEG